jgi:fructose-1,6-bisphosphatase/inositol monophosphatase family enzyme
MFQLGVLIQWMGQRICTNTIFNSISVHTYPFVAISIGLIVKKKCVVGVVYNPIMGEVYWAVEGKGAYRNDEKIHVSKIVKISESLVSTNFPSGISRTQEKYKSMFHSSEALMEKGVHGIRTDGSAVMNLVGVACGRLECYYEKPICSWDVAAGVIIIQEAGGYVCSIDGSEFDVMSKNILASNNIEISKQVLSCLK